MFWEKIAELKDLTGADIRELIKDADLTSTKRLQHGDFVFDFSRTSITRHVWQALIALAAPVPEAREAMFEGQKINVTEQRAVLHTALRARDGAVIPVEGRDVMPQVRATFARMRAFAQSVRDGSYRGAGGAIRDVVNIGIGGSDLGPAMAVRALAPFADGPQVHFVSNIDGADFTDTVRGLDPATTLIIVASKTFTTLETMTNAETARQWMAALPDPAAQFVAVSTATARVAAFGIAEDRMFGFADWVGGRYSLWGPIGLALMIAIGPERFEDFLAGGRDMDDHFQSAPLQRNIPVALALVGLWHHQVCGYPTRAVIPYDQRLSRLPAYLQQLEMESNGKSVCLDGAPSPGPTGPVVWGEPGTNGQHAFFQLIHQGPTPMPVDFLLAARGHEPTLDHHHRLIIANCLAQAKALTDGRSVEEVRSRFGHKDTGLAPHRAFLGNRPSTLMLYPKLTPFVLGQIIACYEHRVFVEGVILGINSFDQWGVELGKEMATELSPLLDTPGAQPEDRSDQATNFAVEQIMAWRSSINR